MYKSVSLKTLELFFLFIICSTPIFSQTQKEPKFGKISLEQLQKTVDEKFPDAHAVVLFDYGTAYYRFLPNAGLRLNTERHIAIQFFDNTKFDLATFEIPLYHNTRNKEKLEGVKGYTYNLTDGKFDRVKFSKKDIIKEEIHDNLDVKKITMPNVKKGSIIELRYNVASDYYSSMNPWYFQGSVPTRYSEYNIEVPEFFTFNKNMAGYFSPHIKKRKETSMEGFRVFTEGWAMTDLPAFEEEDYMRSYKNYISKLNFELKSIQIPFRGVEYFTQSWEKIRGDLMKNKYFGGALKRVRSSKMTDIVEQYESGSDQERMIGIYEHIKKSMKWNGRKNKFSRTGIAKILKEESGNSGDINLALIATLRKAGFKVDPVVLSTRDNGMLPLTHPSIDNLNYVIAAVQLEGKTIYLDATDDYYPAGILPLRCFNGNAVVLKKEQAVLTKNLKPLAQYKSVTQNKLTMTPDGTLEGIMKKTKSGYQAINFRKAYDRADNEEAFVESLQNKQEGLTIKSYTVENVIDSYKPIKEEYVVSLDDKIEMAGDLIYLNPMLNSAYSENPFKMKKRQFPVDYAIPIEETYMFQFDVPEGYIVESMPESSTIGLPEKATFFSYSAKVIGGKITVISRIKITKTIFMESEYEALKEFYNLIIKKHSEQIVLKKS
ncbi:MAG: DUF3857 domain-containing protein [Saprospiraceae bacterium]